MSWTTLGHKTLRVVLAVTVLTVALAPAASAGHRRVRYKSCPSYHGRVVRHVVPAPVYYSRGSCDGPGFAGFVGGLIVGAALNHAAAPRVEYVYMDPYCDEEFISYDSYLGHLRHHRHPRIVRVIEVRSGECVRVSRYDRGRWVDGREWDEDRYEGWDD
jgi:hypothetical protein